MVEALRAHYGLERRLVKAVEPYQMLGEIEADLAEALGIDAIGVAPPRTIFGFRNHGWRPWRAPWGQEILVSADFATSTASNGDTLVHPQGDAAAPPSGRMTSDGYFFELHAAAQAEAVATRDALERLGRRWRLSMPSASISSPRWLNLKNGTLTTSGNNDIRMAVTGLNANDADFFIGDRDEGSGLTPGPLKPIGTRPPSTAGAPLLPPR